MNTGDGEEDGDDDGNDDGGDKQNKDLQVYGTEYGSLFMLLKHCFMVDY